MDLDMGVRMPMRSRSIHEDDPLEDFARREITLDGVTKVVHVAGIGPGGDRDGRDAGHQPARRALCPLGARCRLHGLHAVALRPRRRRADRPRRAPPSSSAPASAPSSARLPANASSPVTHWLRALARAGARGMRRPRRRRDRHVLHRQLRADDDAGARDAGAGAVAAVAAARRIPPASRSRPTSSRPCASGSSARISPSSPIASRATVLPGGALRRLRAALGDRFVARVLPDSAANTDVAPFFAQVRAVPAQRGDGAPDRRSRPADARGARRDPRLLCHAPCAERKARKEAPVTIISKRLILHDASARI